MNSARHPIDEGPLPNGEPLTPEERVLLLKDILKVGALALSVTAISIGGAIAAKKEGVDSWFEHTFGSTPAQVAQPPHPAQHPPHQH